MRVRDGPAAVRGDARRRDATGPRGPGRRRRGSPESEDLPPAVQPSNPSRKEDSCPGSPRSSRSTPRRGARRRVRLAGARRPAADRLALADGDRVAVRDRRRPAGRRRRRPVRLPEAGAADEALRLHARTSRRSPATGPTSSSSRTTRTASSRRCAGSGSACSSRTRPTNLAGAYAQIARSAGSPATLAQATTRGRLDEDADRRAARQGDAARPRADRLPRARARLYSVTSKTFIGRVYELLRAEEHRRRRRHGAAAATRSSRPSTSSREPGHGRARRHRLLRADAAKVAARPGWSNVAAVRTGTIVRIDDSIASRWGPRIVNFVRAVAGALAHLSEVSPRLWILAAALFLVVSLVARRCSSGRCTSASATCSSRSPRRSRSSTSTRRSRRPTRRSSGRSACRGSCSARSSARCSRSPAPRTRACSATRSPTRTCSGSPPAPGSARRSRSSTLRGIDFQNSLPLAAFLGGAVAVVAAYALGRSAGGGARRRDARPRRRHGRVPSSPRSRPSSSSSTRTRCRRSTPGSSAGSSRGWREVRRPAAVRRGRERA